MLYVDSKEEGSVKFVCGRFRGWEKARRGNLRDWMKINWRDRCIHTGGYRIVYHSLFTAHRDGSQGTKTIIMRDSVVSCSGPEKREP